MKKAEHFLESFMFNSRWLLAPFDLGLVLALALLLVKFAKEFIKFVPVVFTGEPADVIIGVLSLIDVVMIANLMVNEHILYRFFHDANMYCNEIQFFNFE